MPLIAYTHQDDAKTAMSIEWLQQISPYMFSREIRCDGESLVGFGKQIYSLLCLSEPKEEKVKTRGKQRRGGGGKTPRVRRGPAFLLPELCWLVALYAAPVARAHEFPANQLAHAFAGPVTTAFWLHTQQIPVGWTLHVAGRKRSNLFSLEDTSGVLNWYCSSVTICRVSSNFVMVHLTGKPRENDPRDQTAHLQLLEHSIGFKFVFFTAFNVRLSLDD